ncbi:hypothetical protein DKM44_04490 [Deinococcus irradiatisoli]|uniref:Uncharacterized protein n=1 Tax=Deinococcus irradiatisoli TaxID=2202254 RepID=A0A2Z3JHW5_9DEIO|nr:hypothetical protein [Deinococcus irradiatisoli]AWN22579.1 hypothetical protein DKM44_04490 [Deinococcus irradiatisoli]
MTGPKRSTKKPASRRGGAKPADQLGKVGPSRPAGPNRDRRTAEGRSGAKASDGRQTARPTSSGLGSAGEIQEKKRPSRAGTRPAGSKPKTGAPRGAALGVDLDAPSPSTVFRDRDGQEQVFAESNLKRVAARILSERRKPWRYRPFPFPLFTDKGNEQAFFFDFYIYDNMDMVLKLILVAPRESAEVWDKIGRFKRQYPMYSYELWTPDKLSRLQNPRTQLGF